jgi:peroxiredoxin
MPFDVTTLDGKHINNISLIGKITWLNFWFEDCPGCRNEFDKLNRLYDSLKTDTDFQFVAITYDKKETLPAFIKQFNLKYPIATVANSAVAQILNYANGFPSNILIDKQGKVVFVRFWLMDREAKYGITLQQAYQKIAKLKQG